MTAKEEAELLVNDLVPFAKLMLREHGEFWPFGGTLGTDGSITQVGGRMEVMEEGTPGELADLLEGAFQSDAAQGKIRAAAIVLNVTLAALGKDAILVRVDHADGYAVRVFFPYAIAGGEVTTDAPFANEGERFAFGGGPASA
ncbi:MAG TPA: hypothetical protein VF841_05685 [Anaeromyxobacter sp.]